MDDSPNETLGESRRDIELPLAYPLLYETPASYQPPMDQLANNLEYPNLIIEDYKSRPIDCSFKIHKMWEAVAVNEVRQLVIATNKCGEEQSGNLIAWDCMNNMSQESAIYKLECPAQITSLRFVKKNMLLVAQVSGLCQLWSTYYEKRDPKHPYCLFKIGSKCEHIGAITSLDAVYDRNIAATGGEDCTLKIWDMSAADMIASHTYRHAHLDGINGVAFWDKSVSVLATCSYDKSVLLWDLRKPKPASALLEHHEARIKSVAWSKSSCARNIIYAGDELGDICAVDMRVPKKIFQKVNAFSGYAIRKILPHKHGYLGLIADTNTVKIFQPQITKFMYTNEDACGYVRDGVWYEDHKLLTVGFDGKLGIHDLSS